MYTLLRRLLPGLATTEYCLLPLTPLIHSTHTHTHPTHRQVTMFWLKRVRDLSPVLRDLLGVENVWCDSRTEQNSQNFVLWAGYILEQR